MRVLTREPANLADLEAELDATGFPVGSYSIAVEGLVFDAQRQWIVLHRGGKARDEVGKLEGIGGRYEGGETFQQALKREFREEIGEDAEIAIVRFLEVKQDIVRKVVNGKESLKQWIILSFLCAHKTGELKIMEPQKCLGIVRVSDLSVDETRLSSSAQKSLATLREKWDSIASDLDHEFGPCKV